MTPVLTMLQLPEPRCWLSYTSTFDSCLNILLIVTHSTLYVTSPHHHPHQTFMLFNVIKTETAKIQSYVVLAAYDLE